MFYRGRHATVRGRELIAGARLRVVNPATQEIMGAIEWADTEWGLLKKYIVSGDKIVTEQDPKTFLYRPKAEYVSCGFDLIDRKDDRVLHQVRHVGDQVIDTWG